MESEKYLVVSGKTMKSILRIFQPRIKEFAKGELILRKDINESRLCLLLKGTAYLCVENEYNAKQLLDFFLKGQFLCHEMLPAPNNGHCFLQAKYPCAVAYLPYQEFLQYTLQHPASELAELAPGIFRSLIAVRNEHCHMLQQKTVRSKLLAFLHYERIQQGDRNIHIPIPYADLADYLTIDRSSLMTELSKMHAEGLLEKKAHTIRLLQYEIR